MDTPRRILDVALKLFCERGYDAVGVQEIVVAAETTKPPLYHHFGNKQGLLEAMVRHYHEPWLERLETVSAYQGDLPLTVYNVAKAFFEFAETNPLFYRLQLSMWFSAPESVPHRVVAPYLLRQHQLMEKLFQSATQDHGNLRGHHTAYAITYTGMLNGYISSLASVGEKATEDVVHAVVRQFMYGIYAL